MDQDPIRYLRKESRWIPEKPMRTGWTSLAHQGNPSWSRGFLSLGSRENSNVLERSWRHSSSQQRCSLWRNTWERRPWDSNPVYTAPANLWEQTSRLLPPLGALLQPSPKHPLNTGYWWRDTLHPSWGWFPAFLGFPSWECVLYWNPERREERNLHPRRLPVVEGPFLKIGPRTRHTSFQHAGAVLGWTS